MSSSLLEILALMEQAIAERGPVSAESESDDPELDDVVVMDDPDNEIAGFSYQPKQNVLDVDRIVKNIFSSKDYSAPPKEKSFATLRDFNSAKISSMEASTQSISDTLHSYFLVNADQSECTDIGTTLNKMLINAAYMEIIKFYNASSAGFENEKLVAFLLNGKVIPAGTQDIADIKIDDKGIGISLKTKKKGVKGSYRDLLHTLGVPYKYYDSPYSVPTAIKNGIKPDIGDNKTPLHENGLFYVFFQKEGSEEDPTFQIYVAEVTAESAIAMATPQYLDPSVKGFIDEGYLNFNQKTLKHINSAKTFLGTTKEFQKLGTSSKNPHFGIANFYQRDVDGKKALQMGKQQATNISQEFVKTLNTLNIYMSIIADSITNYSVKPTAENLTKFQSVLEQMSFFDFKTVTSCKPNDTQSLQEAFSVPKADLTKNGYDGSPHPAAIWQDRQILDNIDLNKFKDMAVNMALRDSTKSESQLKKVASRMEQLVAVIPAIPDESKDEYVKDLFALIDSIYTYWKDRDDGTWFLNNFTKELRSYRSSDIDKLTNKYMGAAELSDEEMEARQKAHDAALAAQAEKEQEAGLTSITSPTFKTSRLPGNLEDYNAVMDRMFGNSDSLRERVLKLSQLATLFGGSEQEIRAKIDKMSNLDFMSRVVMMDYLVEVAKSFDSTAGRYLLEYLLAVVAKGRVTGADLGKYGLAGAVDFKSSSGEFGSSKFLSSYDDALQSVDAFKEGEKVTYVVAVREGNPRRLNNNRAPAPLDLQSIKMHIFDITKTASSFDIEVDKASGGKKTIKLGTEEAFFQSKNGNWTHLNIGKIAEANQNNAFTIPLVFTTEEGTKTYRQMLSSELTGNKKELLAIVKDLFDELKKADEMSRKYVVTGKPEEGGKAMDSLEIASDKLDRISNHEGYEKIS